MAGAPVHRGEVLATPWPGVHGTRLDSARHYARHWHADFGFGLLERGTQQSASGRGEVRAVAGDVITTNPGEVHDGRPVDGAARCWRMLYLEPDAVAAVLGTPAGGLAFTQPVHRERHRQAAIAALFRRLDAGPARNGDAAARMACDEALARCCTALLAPAQPADDAPDAALRAVRERLADDPLAAPTLAELAAMAGCSRFQLLRRFAAVYGLPPHAWLLQQRAELARRLIRDGARLADAATGAGFADQSHLTRCFVRLFGYTPGDWQRAAARSPGCNNVQDGDSPAPRDCRIHTTAGLPMSTSITGYVHGHSENEHQRLNDQADTLAGLLHCDITFPAGSRVLEVGCGVGAQTLTLAARSPHARFTSIDIDAGSVHEARRRADAAGLRNVEFRQADLFALPFAPASFDHAFVCFVLEHLARPIDALAALRTLLRPSGTLTVIEGDHGPTVFHPDSAAAREAIACQVALQRRAGGDACIGRALYPLLCAAGYGAVQVQPRVVYADASRPALVEGFTRRTFTAMIAGVREPAVAAGLIDAARFDEGLAALERTTQPDGSFLYVFFKGTASAPAS